MRVLKEQGVRTGIVGYLPCHETRLTRRHPEMLHRIKALIKLADNLHAEHLRDFYEKQLSIVEKVPRYRLVNSVSTTIYITKN